MHEDGHFFRKLLIYGSFAIFIFICWVVFKPMLSSEMKHIGKTPEEIAMEDLESESQDVNEAESKEEGSVGEE